MLLHIKTEKGMGYPPAMKASDKMHGVAKFDLATGKQMKGKGAKAPSLTSVFANELIKVGWGLTVMFANRFILHPGHRSMSERYTKIRTTGRSLSTIQTLSQAFLTRHSEACLLPHLTKTQIITPGHILNHITSHTCPRAYAQGGDIFKHSPEPQH